MKKILSLFIAAAALISLAACGDSAKVYVLNFKPEADDAMKEIAASYEKEKGVKVKILTAASGTYEDTLSTEVLKSNAPTIFTINGPVGYKNWKDYTYDLANTTLYKEQLSANGKNIAVKDGAKVAGIPVTVEGYGLVYNKTIFENYFKLTSKADTGCTKVADINNYAKLKAVVEDMQAHKSDLGIDAVFATCLKDGSQWPYQTHTMNIPTYFEFKEIDATKTPLENGLAAKTLAFKYADNYKNIMDLYINNSVTAAASLDGTDYDAAVAQFATGKAAVIQQGNWVYSNVAKTTGATVTAETIGMMPIYTGINGESDYSICVGTENYWCVNKKVSQAKIDASIAFMEWLFGSTTGKKAVVEKLGFIAPFSTFTATETPADPLAKEVLRYMSDTKLKTIDWSFAAFPSESWKNVLGSALVAYSKDNTKWNEVVTNAKTKWESERK